MPNYTRDDAALGKPFPLFHVGGKLYTVPIRSMATAEEWLSEYPEKVADAESAMQADRNSETRTAYREALADAVFEYGEMKPNHTREEVIDKGLTDAQLIEAYVGLYGVTDPFTWGQTSGIERMKDTFRGLPIPKGAVERALEKQAVQ